MNYEWMNSKPVRPDRYLDWSVQNRAFYAKNEAGQTQETKYWNPVIIEMHATNEVGEFDANIAYKNLERLKQEIDAEGTSGENQLKILMHSVERGVLESKLYVLGENLDGSGKIDRAKIALNEEHAAYFDAVVFLEERLTYLEGEFWHRDYFSIRMAGPPVENVRMVGEVSLRNKLLVKPSSDAVAIGIIDDGIAFAHDRFSCKSEEGSGTRIQRLWFQEPVEVKSGLEVVVGSDLDKDAIDKLLAESALQSGNVKDIDVYRKSNAFKLGDPDPNSLIFHQTHGAHVMDLACGYPVELEVKNRPIYAVQLPRKVTAATSGVLLPFYVLMGMRYIMNWADYTWLEELPLVLNFSYGITAGPKDGSHPLVLEFERMLKERNTRVVNRRDKPGIPTKLVMPSGNSYEDKLVAEMYLEDKAKAIDWIIKPDDKTESYLEIWLSESSEVQNEAPLTLSLTPPQGTKKTFEVLRDGDIHTLVCRSGEDTEGVCGVYYDCIDRNSLTELEDLRFRSRILIAVNRTNTRDGSLDKLASAPPGRWNIELKNRDSSVPLKVDIYVQRDDTPVGFEQQGRQSYLDDEYAHKRRKLDGSYTDHTPEESPTGPQSAITYNGTLNALAGTAMNASTEISKQHVIMVGAAMENYVGETDVKPSRYTSSGPTKANNGPCLSINCDVSTTMPGIYAAGSLSGYMVALSGTSMAAPQVTRMIADTYDPKSDEFTLSSLIANAITSGRPETLSRLGNSISSINNSYADRAPHEKRRRNS